MHSHTFPTIPLDLPQRRDFLLKTFRTAGAISLTGFLAACGGDDEASATPTPPVTTPKFNPFASFSALQTADANGVMLPKGFTSRIVARSGQPPVAGGSFKWHSAPDGGATYPIDAGGWIYVSNAEMTAPFGGASALKFDKAGKVIDAYAILKDTSGNCAGGPTPWNTWLSCEEFELTQQIAGLVWECDPYKPVSDASPPKSYPALGRFAHEAVCVDPTARMLYMTEDASGGRVYRYVCDATDWPVGAAKPVKFESGQLQVLRIDALPRDADSSGADYAGIVGFGKAPLSITWEAVAFADQGQKNIRNTLRAGGILPAGNYFQKAEGIWFFNGIVFFVTSSNSRIWAYDTANRTLEVIFDGALGPVESHSINRPDNITITSFGEMLVAEDGGNLEIGVLRDNGTSQAVMRLVGHDNSEITGPAVSPDGTRLYFSSQRGTSGKSEEGITFEVLLPTKLVN